MRRSHLACCAAIGAAACGRIGFESDTVDAEACASLPETDPAYCGPLVLATGQYLPYGLAITPTDVYWLNSGDGALMRCAKAGCGGAPTQIAMGKPDGFFVAVDATHVYWNHNTAGEVQRCPLDGCPGLVPELLAMIGSATFVAVDGTYLYTSTNVGRLVRVPKGGGAPFDLAAGLIDPGGIQVVGSSILWAIIGENRIVSVPIAGGTPDPIVVNQTGVRVVATNASTMVWATATAILRSDLAGQNIVMVANAEAPFGLAIDDTHVYWSNTDGTSVVKAPLAGGASTVLATGLSSPAVLAVDERYVYFTSTQDGTVHRVPR